jgi:hypothetical protein
MTTLATPPLANPTLPVDNPPVKAADGGSRFRFRLRGKHIEQIVVGTREIVEHGEKRTEVITTDRTYNQGTIIETDEDLHAKYDQPGMPPKFEPLQNTDPSSVEGLDAEIARLLAKREALASGRAPIPVPSSAPSGFSSGPGPALPPGPVNPASRQAERDASVNYRGTLEAMSIEELKGLAATEEIDLKGASKKADIVNTILAAQ